jgi:hypothetical protein
MPIKTNVTTINEVYQYSSHQLMLVCDDGGYLVDINSGLNLYYLAFGIGENTPMRAALHIDTAHNQVIEIDIIGKP